MEWYYLRDGKTMGPVPEASIRAWLESGFLLPEDLLWRAGMTQWLPVVELAEFGGSGGPEPEARPNQEAWRGTTGDRDAGVDRPAATGLEPGPNVPGGPAEGSEASRLHESEPSSGSSGGPDWGSTAIDGPGALPSSPGSSGGVRADAGRGPAGASPWSHSQAAGPEAPAVYANIWARAGAAAIDLMILVSAVLLVFRPELPTSGNIEDMTKLSPAITPVFMAVAWLYFGLMEGSALQGSLGKLAFGLKVTDLDGNRLLPGRALVRGLLKVVLMEITAFLSFLPAAFTSHRQALHDIVAGSTVLLR